MPVPPLSADFPDAAAVGRSLKPVRTRLHAERAYHELRRSIVRLQLAPGTVLREDELMEQLGIGRTPLREAIKRLELENLVAVQPRRGTMVTEVDAADIVHITEVRAELEGFAAHLASLRMDAMMRDTVQSMLDELKELDGPQAGLMEFDERAHRLVWTAARNPYLAQTLEHYFALSLRIWYLVLDRVPGLGGAVHDQAQLLEALLAHDSAGARTLMRDHVLAFQREVVAAFSRP